MQSTLLLPGSAGYEESKIRFIGTNGRTLKPVLKPKEGQLVLPSREISVLPISKGDNVSCLLRTATQDVKIVLDLPRLWWRLEGIENMVREWGSTPLRLTRHEFKELSHRGAYLSVLSNRHRKLHAGFSEHVVQPYSRRIHDEFKIKIPLADFEDYREIDQPLLETTKFNVALFKKTLALIEVVADTKPEIVSFSSGQKTILCGQETTLEWSSKLTENALITIDPDIGKVEHSGTCVVRPTQTTLYTLTISQVGADKIYRTLSVVVKSLEVDGKRTLPLVRTPSGGWRMGKGFSRHELFEAGMSLTDAKKQLIRIDVRRRSSHLENTDSIRSNPHG